jgi:Tol biopolymer transport system component
MLAFVHFREPGLAIPQPLRFQVFAPEKTTFDSSLSLSPDGRRLAFAARAADGRSQLWIRDLDSLQSRLLTGTDGEAFVFWSPDSRSPAFTDGSKLKRIDALRGPAQIICDVPGARLGQVAWNTDGVILFGITPSNQSEGLHKVAAGGGSPSLVTRPDPLHPSEFHDFPSFLSDGKRFLYSRLSGRKRVVQKLAIMR